MNNSGRLPGGKSGAVLPPPDLELWAYDQLPPEVRQAIGRAAFQASAATVLHVMRSKGYSAGRMVEMLRTQDARLSREFRAELGIPD